MGANRGLSPQCQAILSVLTAIQRQPNAQTITLHRTFQDRVVFTLTSSLSLRRSRRKRSIYSAREATRAIILRAKAGVEAGIDHEAGKTVAVKVVVEAEVETRKTTSTKVMF